MVENGLKLPRRIAVLIDRIGPYHKARLDALGKRASVLAVEICGKDNIYSWEQQTNGSFTRVTLFPNRAAIGSASQLKASVEVTLENFDPHGVAVPGWGDPSALFAYQWARRKGVMVVIMSDSQVDDSPRTSLGEWIKRKIVSQASGALVGGESHADYVEKLGIRPEQVRLGYDVVDNAHFSEGARRARENPGIRERFGLPRQYILSIGRFVEKKNLPLLLQAHARWIKETKDHIPLLMVGDGPLEGLLKEQAGEKVHVRPFAKYSELPVLFGLADAFILPSLSEQWGLTVNEAMASRCLVLGSNRAGAVRELVVDGLSGITFNPTLEGILGALRRVGEIDKIQLLEAAEKEIQKWSPERFCVGLMGLFDQQELNGAKRASFLFNQLIRILARRQLAQTANIS